MAEASEKLLDALKLLENLEQAKEDTKFQKAQTFKPWFRQMEFFTLGATRMERGLFAGNQLGKSEAGALESYFHMSGRYPDYWQGHRFTRPTRGWICGESGILCRDVGQTKLCGPPGVESGLGTGMIPLAEFVDKPTLSRGVTDAFDTIQVRHVSGGVSTATFKSYEQGRKKFQGEPIDWIWCDEEPPEDIYLECMTRLLTTRGIIYTTFTPLQGKTTLVTRFFDEASPDRGKVMMSLDECPHIPAEQKARMLAAWPGYQRDARSKGLPIMGEGRIFPYPDDMIWEDYHEYLPPHWALAWGIDFGIGHAFAAILFAWDKDNDVFHIIAAVRMKDALPIHHAKAMKQICEEAPVIWPQDGTAREKGTGETLADVYRHEGLKMCAEHATWPDGGRSTEAGILEMQERMQTARLKVAKHLLDWFEEYHDYHRKDGQIVKVNDDLMSATRHGIMAKRFARPGIALGPSRNAKRGRRGDNDGMARGLDYDVWSPTLA